MKNFKRSAETASSIVLENRRLEYLLKRSSRKTISISVKRDGQVTVSCPLKVSQDYINQLLIKKAGWIFTKVDEVGKNTAGAPVRTFSEGDILYFLGNAFKLKIIISNSVKKSEVRLEQDFFVLETPEIPDREAVKTAIRNWYIAQARKLLEERIRIYSKNMGVNPKKLSIREQRTRWGSCSTKGNLNMNWRLVMAPLEVLDYVVVHELSHLIEMNHSQNFWRIVEGVTPGYKVYRKWLKDNGSKLSVE